MKTHNLIWKSLSHLSTEYTRVIELHELGVMGNIVGNYKSTPFAVEYHLTLDKFWQIKRVLIKLIPHNSFIFSFQRDDSGVWLKNHEEVQPELQGCDFMDISLTPFTNSLPILNLNLEVNESREIKVLYFDLPKGEYRPQRQRYTYKGNGIYK